MSKIQFYNEVNKKLKPFIHHYWYINDMDAGHGEGDLLPMDHVDLIISQNPLFNYSIGGIEIEASSVHCHGIRLGRVKVVPQGRVTALGISFRPWGFYRLAGSNMDTFVDKIINFEKINDTLSTLMIEAVSDTDKIDDIISDIEKALIPHFEDDEKRSEDERIIRKFIIENPDDIHMFCNDQNISVRQLTRIFNKYVGLSPKAYMNLIKFENSSRSVLYDEDISLTDITYSSDYYDQSHFTRNFKKFTKYSPKKFKKEKPALKTKLYADTKNDT